MIIDLSYPKTNTYGRLKLSVDSPIYVAIIKMLFTELCIELGRNTYYVNKAKINIKRTIRLLPVHPADRHILGMEWRNSIYLNKCLAFGPHSVPKSSTFFLTY